MNEDTLATGKEADDQKQEVLGRSAFFQECALQRELVNLRPHLPGSVWVHAPTVDQREIWEVKALKAQRGREEELLGMKVDMAITLCHDDDGNKIFNKGDAKALGRLPGGTFDPVRDAVNRLCGWDKAESDSQVGNSERTSLESSATD